MSESIVSIKNPIIIFDGYCNFCSSSVDFIMKHDKKKLFLFAASQLPSGEKLIKEYNLNNVDSIVLVYKNKSYRYSTAVLKISSLLGMPFNIFSIFLIVPAFLRDNIYKWIAKNRYKWFGKRNTCRIPNQKEMNRFI